MSNENITTRKTRKPYKNTDVIQKQQQPFENASALLQALSNPSEAFKVQNRIIAIDLGNFNVLRIPADNYSHMILFSTNKSEHGVDYTFQCGLNTHSLITKGTFPIETAQESINQVHNASKAFDEIYKAAKKDLFPILYK